jgi:hypothetical protein
VLPLGKNLDRERTERAAQKAESDSPYPSRSRRQKFSSTACGRDTQGLCPQEVFCNKPHATQPIPAK